MHIGCFKPLVFHFFLFFFFTSSVLTVATVKTGITEGRGGDQVCGFWPRVPGMPGTKGAAPGTAMRGRQRHRPLQPWVQQGAWGLWVLPGSTGPACTGPLAQEPPLRPPTHVCEGQGSGTTWDLAQPSQPCSRSAQGHLPAPH